MGQYVMVFRPASRQSTPETEQAWGDWFGSIRERIVDFGRRVGQARTLGDGPTSPDELGGYLVISADDLDATRGIARGCPGLRHGGRVEVGAVITSEH